jgi:hypothetical protein
LSPFTSTPEYPAASIRSRLARQVGVDMSSGKPKIATVFGSQRPETRVETMSWYCRFLLLMTLARQLN